MGIGWLLRQFAAFSLPGQLAPRFKSSNRTWELSFWATCRNKFPKAKVPQKQKFHGMKVPRSESSRVLLELLFLEAYWLETEKVWFL